MIQCPRIGRVWVAWVTTAGLLAPWWFAAPVELNELAAVPVALVGLGLGAAVSRPRPAALEAALVLTAACLALGLTPLLVHAEPAHYFSQWEARPIEFDELRVFALWLAVAALGGGAVGLAAGDRPSRAAAPLLLGALVGAHCHWRGINAGPMMACATGVGAFFVAGLGDEARLRAPAARTLAAFAVAGGLLNDVLTFQTADLPTAEPHEAYGVIWWAVRELAARSSALPARLLAPALLLGAAWIRPRAGLGVVGRGDTLPLVVLSLALSVGAARTLEAAVAPVEDRFDRAGRNDMTRTEAIPSIPGPEPVPLPWPMRGAMAPIRGLRLLVVCTEDVAPIGDDVETAQDLATWLDAHDGLGTITYAPGALGDCPHW